MVKVVGVEEIKKKLREASVTMGFKIQRGQIKAGLFLQRESQKVVPIEFGVLMNSAGTKAIGASWFTDVIVYYTASYAVYVHERTELKHKKGKMAKFLETPMRENRDKILRIIAGEAAL
jgi:hypothetical protein